MEEYRRMQQLRFAAHKQTEGSGQGPSSASASHHDGVNGQATSMVVVRPAGAQHTPSSGSQPAQAHGHQNVQGHLPGQVRPPAGQAQASSGAPKTALDIFKEKQAPHGVVRLLTWNIDGLDDSCDDIVERLVNGVIDSIVELAPSIVLLQEVIDPTLKVLRRFLDPLFHILAPTPTLMPYFSVILLQKGRCKKDEAVMSWSSSSTSTVPPQLQRTRFPTTRMGRELLSTRVSVDSLSLQVCTAHLESTKDGTEERKRQLDIAFQYLQQEICRTSSAPGGGAFPSSSDVDLALFGGDLNLRDAEAKAALGKMNPPKPKAAAKKAAQKSTAAAGALSSSVDGGAASSVKIQDCWELAGSDADQKFTWDLQRNNNAKMPGPFVPRCRFDRLFAATTVGNTSNLVCSKFRLVGTRRLPHGRFPSDHFGILAEFRMAKRETSSTHDQFGSSISRPQNVVSGATSGAALNSPPAGGGKQWVNNKDGPVQKQQQQQPRPQVVEPPQSGSNNKATGATTTSSSTASKDPVKIDMVVSDSEDEDADSPKKTSTTSEVDPNLLNAFVAALRGQKPSALSSATARTMSTTTGAPTSGPTKMSAGTSTTSVAAGTTDSGTTAATSSSSTTSTTSAPQPMAVNRRSKPFAQLRGKLSKESTPSLKKARIEDETKVVGREKDQVLDEHDGEGQDDNVIVLTDSDDH
ncbi:unnamed protein product [Amoebophrya sp. A25]|nr:unnamed protein product [Amoebophrya sp. A25]|eukprot:GSA25T00019846001.1